MSSTVEKTIDKKLRAAFSPSQLDVINESYKHAGHHHDHGQTFERNGQTHFRIKIVSSSFINMSRLDIHRAINDILSDELKNGVHALAIEAKTAA